MSAGAWVVIDVVVGIALGLLAGVPIGLVLGYDWAAGMVARKEADSGAAIPDERA